MFTLNIYGREIDGEIVNFRSVDYRDLNINFAMLFNPQFANNIPHEYLATAKFETIEKFDETSMLEVLPSLSMIKIADYLRDTNFLGFLQRSVKNRSSYKLYRVVWEVK